MRIRLDIPFLPEADYTAFLAAHRRGIHSLYFSLFTTPAVDARFRLGPWKAADLFQYLPQLAGIPAYALLNSRFYHPDTISMPACWKRSGTAWRPWPKPVW